MIAGIVAKPEAPDIEPAPAKEPPIPEPDFVPVVFWNPVHSDVLSGG